MTLSRSVFGISLIAFTALAAQAGTFPKITPFPGASAIVGRIEAKPECKTGDYVAWVSQENILLYQVDVAQHGTFEFHVLPGEYNFVVTSSSGCFVEQKLLLKAGEARELAVQPVPAPRGGIKHSFVDWLVPSAQAMYLGGNCPTCAMMANYQMQPSFMPMMPWWGGYGAMAYSNFGYPGPWYGGGMMSPAMMSPGMGMGMMGPGVMGNMYPGHGGVGVAKPVLYLEGKDGTEISVKADLTGQGNWLVAVPAHGQDASSAGWKGKLQSNRLVTPEGAEFSYLFYDYRSDPQLLQDQSGFCATRAELIPRMAKTLVATGFKANEVRDFTSYWAVKIPPSKRYCVYPQTTTELAKLAPLKIEPAPASLTQVVFVIQVDEGLTGKGEQAQKFTQAPARPWKFEGPVVSARAPAAESGLKVREWGVAFMMIGKAETGPAK